MEIADYIFFSLTSFTFLVIIAVACYGLYCWWKAKKSEPRSCYVAIADETSPLLSQCTDPCVFGCRVCKNVSSSIGASPPVFSPTYRTPGSKHSNKVLVTSGGFPITTPLLRTGSSSRSRFGSTNCTKRSSKNSLKKFTLIRDYTPETYDNEGHTARTSRPASDLEGRMSETVSATASSSNSAETILAGIHSNHHSETIQAEVHPSTHSDPSSATMAPMDLDLDPISVQEQSSSHSDPARTPEAYSRNHSEPATLEVTECTTTNAFTPARYSTPSYLSHALRSLSSSSDYAGYSSADNSWESTSSSITCALDRHSSSPTDKNDVNIPPIRKGSIQYVVKDGKGFYTSDTSVFSSVPL